MGADPVKRLAWDVTSFNEVSLVLRIVRKPALVRLRLRLVVPVRHVLGTLMSLRSSLPHLLLERLLNENVLRDIFVVVVGNIIVLIVEVICRVIIATSLPNVAVGGLIVGVGGTIALLVLSVAR